MPDFDNASAVQFRERVRIRLAAMNTTQADLARDHGMSPQALSDIISGFPNVHYRSVEKLSAMLHVEPAWLIGGDPRDAIPNAEEVLDG